MMLLLMWTMGHVLRESENLTYMQEGTHGAQGRQGHNRYISYYGGYGPRKDLAYMGRAAATSPSFRCFHGHFCQSA